MRRFKTARPTACWRRKKSGFAKGWKRGARALKAAFDPMGLLNPGKAIPTLARCAEYGAMHVHNGNLPYPDIDRL